MRSSAHPDYAVLESRHREIRRVLRWTLAANVAVVLANAAGEDEADRIGKAVLEALQLAESLGTGPF